MSYDNPILRTAQSVDAPPVSVVRKGRQTATAPPYTQKPHRDVNDPPGLPVSTDSRVAYHNLVDGMNGPRSVQLVNEEEKLNFDDCESFAAELGCPMDQLLKVVAIVGNTGDGKSYTMNHTFFDRSEVFLTSSSQCTCTTGVWAAYAPSQNCLVLDTEGLLGTTLNQNQHRRLLLKVFAVADIVIYLTKAPRLHADMFTFLADASDSFAQHFRPELETLAKQNRLPWSHGQLGPAVIVFQETRHTDPLDGPKVDGKPLPYHRNEGSNPLKDSDENNPVTSVLQHRIAEMNRNVDSFSTLEYIGIQTTDCETNFERLKQSIARLLKDNSIRAPRKLEHIFYSLQSLNAQFAGSIRPNGQYTFVEEYFTCPVQCDVCSIRCCLGVGHTKQPHQASMPTSADGSERKANPVGCRYDPSLKNKLYYCKDCYAEGKRNMVVPKAGESMLDAPRYFYSGYVLECKVHGTIYQSRNLWSSNEEPERTARVHWEVVHVWSGEKTILQGIHTFSQVLVDGVNSVTKHITGLAAPPARFIGDYLADSMAPDYWVPNANIRNCAVCNFKFPDPLVDGADFDLGTRPQQQRQKQQDKVESDGGRSRPKSKSHRSSIAAPSSRAPPVSDDNAAPHTSPDHHASSVPDLSSLDVAKHHCRMCGRGVCGACSSKRLRVPGFGLDPVRVCDDCFGRHNGGPKTTSKSVAKDIQVESNTGYTGRRALELCSAAVRSITPVVNFVTGTAKDFARPAYWTPDNLCKYCAVCDQPFNASRLIHHCRACGRGVCEPCSGRRMPVPWRGLDLPHRVCNECFKPAVQ
ncbi:Zinc finger FYVE domain-containing protein 1 [Clonorchis sinensis]|uniref:Zinc finger FYVE domain-containing protein 1 n=1 Tax=Clonorchis sinensis TaxID=79923 RepID=A0A8T1MFU5_CLOSI|nr:Zinc finger FYVE domain-containing protein 1 [Clonorchis sinensis]